ncbi:Arginase/deacetylase [Cyberlindnera jadinii NRRL Y-1542]|uniref:Histone deacetylase n=1 Tax=Cyberlindnera jadinii (strain ATCC 18201 / CBS 1600 / BCRC 20928 / JCM 3617 / NBRC 0987 / NRRL Y-1542) TaxID=983966 RepID=A0A1E4RU46_CYBJN|nr:Arginase/deacetylase [Cyberlindnera jadinii NRRL Y-1542]ODV70797.1 Arginase/deacetylase [Cyberlindnera jadinii NRRL Y-1542]
MRPVAIVHSGVLTALSDELPANAQRSSLVSSMIESYGLLSQCSSTVTVQPASRDQLRQFHGDEFVDEVLRRRCDGAGEGRREQLVRLGLSEDEFGLLFDCPLFPLMDQYVRYVAGSTISAAKHLVHSVNESIVINWHGGRHHAKKSRAAGFCYVNDVVLGILELRKRFQRIVYIDLDLHHGDGVESAFKFSDSVVTMSIHRKDIGFYPGTGDLGDQGIGRGKGYTFNAPMRHGLGDSSLNDVVDKCFIPVIHKFQAQCLVIQCGADGLGSDEHQEWNLTIKGLANAVVKLLDLELPSLLLGGGGYNHSQVARCWTYITSVALQASTEFDILPDSLMAQLQKTHSEEEEEYEFWNDKGHNMIDENTPDYIDVLANQFTSRSWM